MDKLFFNLSNLNFKDFAFAIFTSNTFKTIHKTASISSVLKSKEEVLSLAKKYFPNLKHHHNQYKLEFENNIDMFRYIKKTGVSGNRAILSYKQTKELINKYPLNYLEFEVIFLYS
jgi:malonyl-CoA O-methyltransferase